MIDFLIQPCSRRARRLERPNPRFSTAYLWPDLQGNDHQHANICFSKICGWLEATIKEHQQQALRGPRHVCEDQTGVLKRAFAC